MERLKIGSAFLLVALAGCGGGGGAADGGLDVRPDLRLDVKIDMTPGTDTSTTTDVPPGFDVPGPTCTDRVLNGNETGVDCGGDCPGCPVGSTCTVPADCQTEMCVGGRCVGGNCTDLAMDGMETDVDCGGGCPPCFTGKTCLAYTDCVSFVCWRESARRRPAPTASRTRASPTPTAAARPARSAPTASMRVPHRLHGRPLRHGPLLVVPRPDQERRRGGRRLRRNAVRQVRRRQDLPRRHRLPERSLRGRRVHLVRRQAAERR